MLSPYAILLHILNPQALQHPKLKISFTPFLVPGKLGPSREKSG